MGFLSRTNSSMPSINLRDYDIHPTTGFMPPSPPVPRLPRKYELWETLLADGIGGKLQLGDAPNITCAEVHRSEEWRTRARRLPVLSVDNLLLEDSLTRRAHHVLSWLLHIYVHTLPPFEPILIPPPITLPVLQISQHLSLPPVLTYSDCVLYNWAYIFPGNLSPTTENIRCQTLFTGTNDEQEFQLVSARIELHGAGLLPLMVRILDAPHGPANSDQIATELKELAECVRGMRELLLAIQSTCRPEVFYHAVRPWIRGQDVDLSRGAWIFEGATEAGLRTPTELSGPSAGQSSLIQALDVFLGVDAHTHVRGGTGGPAPAKKAFLARMQAYMPAKHRAFLNALAEHPGAVRTRVESDGDEVLRGAYNEAVSALKEFRDAHMIIAALFIAVPSRKARPAGEEGVVVKGTGGTDMLRFLKSVRDQTTASIIASA